ncbi:MAG: hypothetical protein JNK64_35375 [Myxococcales bacterium]|nr:hypothetical protein [Myxococcales bacterium]
MRAAIALCLLLMACDDDPTCEALADHVAALAAKDRGSTVTVADRAALIRNCQAEASSNRAMRRCVMKATTLVDAKECELRAAFGR